MGCWVSYGLGSMNENLPTFVVLPDHRGLASNGTKNWDSRVPPRPAPGDGRSTPARKTPDRRPVPGRAGDVHHASERRGRASTCSTQLNREHAAARPGDERLDARIQSYELAAKMQLAAPEALDLSKEPAHILKLYGLDHGKTSFDKEINPVEETDYFGRKCLVARRLLERGVRFVQIWSGNDNGFPRRNWDSHEDVKRDHGPLAARHGPRRRGPDPGPQAARPARRHDHPLDHRVRPHAVSPGRQGPRPQPLLLHQLALRRRHQGRHHATARATTSATSPPTASTPPRSTTSTPPILHLLGIDHTKLTVRHNGIDRRLTDVHGHVIPELLR